MATVRDTKTTQSTDENATPAVVVDTRRSPQARLHPLPVSAFRFTDDFWAPRLKINREVTIPGQHQLLEDTHRLRNFRRVAGKVDAPQVGKYFNDTDVYKWLEAAAWVYASTPDDDLDTLMDRVIDDVASAQREDGYLNTYFALERADQRWTIPDLHEAYCAGHLFQAAVAHHRATGKRNLLDVALRMADHICDTLGPEEEGKIFWLDGHEEVKMGLVELYRVTGIMRYLHQAEFFLDNRGYQKLPVPYNGHYTIPYHQDHLPLREMDEPIGHAVRMLYYTCGATDIYLETADESILTALTRIWDRMTSRRMYVSGGLGSRWDGESFGGDFELTNDRAYTETCAAIASVMWNWRLLSITGDARHTDLLEHTLYNAVLPGLSLDGATYFYQNPLENDGSHRRQPWFGVACCPPNVARTLGSLSGYVASVSDDTLWLHLYAQGSLQAELATGQTINLEVQTRYPWDGEITITVATAGEYALKLRVPGWCKGDATLTINGEPSAEPLRSGDYVKLRRSWRAGDTITLNLPMPVRRIVSHPWVSENTDQIALMRGPILYCVEAADNLDANPRDITLPLDGEITAEFSPDLLGGVVALTSPATVVEPTDIWRDRLYLTLGDGEGWTAPHQTTITAIPYYAWANREAGTMRVWLRAD